VTEQEALAVALAEQELVKPVNDIFMIDPETRTINVPDSERLFGVQSDEKAERKYFKCPKIVGNNSHLFISVHILIRRCLLIWIPVLHI
jgi:hypothetical protein